MTRLQLVATELASRSYPGPRVPLGRLRHNPSQLLLASFERTPPVEAAFKAEIPHGIVCQLTCEQIGKDGGHGSFWS
jgi:hypothetical protein